MNLFFQIQNLFFSILYKWLQICSQFELCSFIFFYHFLHCFIIFSRLVPFFSHIKSLLVLCLCFYKIDWFHLQLALNAILLTSAAKALCFLLFSVFLILIYCFLWIHYGFLYRFLYYFYFLKVVYLISDWVPFK